MKITLNSEVNRIKIIGLQRTGTNFLTDLIKNNTKDSIKVCGANQINGLFWKHAGPFENRKVFSKHYDNAYEALVDNKDTFPILVSKHPFQWLDSIQRYKADLHRQRKVIYDNNTLNLDKALRLYFEFYAKWYEVIPRLGIHVRYVDVLFDPQKFMDNIFEKELLKHKKVDPPPKVAWSTGDYKQMLKRYSLEPAQKPEYLEAFNRADPALKAVTRSMGYTV